jgi:hypothetical protein
MGFQKKILKLILISVFPLPVHHHHYRVKGQLQLPIGVSPKISFTNGQYKVNVAVLCKVAGKALEDVVITIPFPKNSTSNSLSANIGTVQFNDMTKVSKEQHSFSHSFTLLSFVLTLIHASVEGLQMDDSKVSERQNSDTGRQCEFGFDHEISRLEPDSVSGIQNEQLVGIGIESR